MIRYGMIMLSVLKEYIALIFKDQYVLEECFVKDLLIVEDEGSAWYIPGSDYPMMTHCHIPVPLRF